MIGHHGIPGAPRAGVAVLSDPVRRALVLGGLLLAALAAVWLAAAPAQAEERPARGPDVLAGVGEGLQQQVSLDVTELQEPLAGTVTDAGERATQVVEETSGHLPTDTGAPEVPGLGEVTQRVHDDVHTVVENVPEGQGGPAHQDGAAVEKETEQDGDENTPRPREAAPAESPSPVEETVSAPERAPAAAVAEPVDEGPDTGDATPAAGSGSGGSTLPSPSAPTAPAHGAAPGYLSAPGAPAPAPGELQAARHVLRSVPAAPADEATFSPD